MSRLDGTGVAATVFYGSLVDDGRKKGDLFCVGASIFLFSREKIGSAVRYVSPLMDKRMSLALTLEQCDSPRQKEVFLRGSRRGR